MAGMRFVRFVRVAPTLAVFVAAAMWVGTPAFAQSDEPDYAREGAYVGLGGFFALENASGTADDSGGVSALLGLRIVSGVSLELEGSWVGEITDDDLGGLSSNIKLYLAELSDGAILGGRFQPYIMGSAGFVWAGGSAGARIGGGAGAEFYLTENIALNSTIAYYAHGGEPSDTRYGSFLLGALYRF